MRMPRVRFTVRKMMLVVAIVSLALAIAVEADRVERFRENLRGVAQQYSRDEAWNQNLEAESLESAPRAQAFVAVVAEFEQVLRDLPRSHETNAEDELCTQRRQAAGTKQAPGGGRG